MAKYTLPEILEQVDRMPGLPEIALRVSRMLEDTSTNAEKLSQVIRLDPSLTTQVLRLCNSAAYGFSRKVATVREAVAILGFNVIKSLVYTIICHNTLQRPIKGYGLDQGALWQNALTCAVYAKFIAEQQRFSDPELAFTGAILRDIGKIILGEYVGDSYNDIEALVNEEQIDFVSAEERVVGCSHTLLGMKIAEKWNLPENLMGVIRHHHNPSQMPSEATLDERKLVTIVHLADAFTMIVGNGIGGDGMMYSLDIDALEQIGIDIQGPYLESTLGQLVDLQSVIQGYSDSLSAQEA